MRGRGQKGIARARKKRRRAREDGRSSQRGRRVGIAFDGARADHERRTRGKVVETPVLEPVRRGVGPSRHEKEVVRELIRQPMQNPRRAQGEHGSGTQRGEGSSGLGSHTRQRLGGGRLDVIGIRKRSIADDLKLGIPAAALLVRERAVRRTSSDRGIVCPRTASGKEHPPAVCNSCTVGRPGANRDSPAFRFFATSHGSPLHGLPARRAVFCSGARVAQDARTANDPREARSAT